MALTRKTKTGTDIGYGLDGAGGSVTPTSIGMAAAVTADNADSAPLSVITGIETGGELTLNVTAKNGQGETVAHVVGAKKSTLKIDGYASAYSAPKLADVIVHNGVSGLVISSSITASNEDFVRASASVEGADGIAYGAGTG